MGQASGPKRCDGDLSVSKKTTPQPCSVTLALSVDVNEMSAFMSPRPRVNSKHTLRKLGIKPMNKSVPW